MKHTKKKATILTVATTIVGSGAIRTAGGHYIEAGILFLVAGALFGAYEYLNWQEIPVDAETIEDGAEQIADDAGEALEKESKK